jgi:hypothetical protein
MKTDHLIDVLTTNLEPSSRGRLAKSLMWALVIGGVAAFALMLATVGLRPDIAGTDHLAVLAVKVAFTLSLAGAGAALLARLMRSGRYGRRFLALALLPFIAVTLAGLAVAAMAPPGAKMATGSEWASCVVCIPLFAVIPFVALIWALRLGAPTKLVRTGAIAGLVAGAIGATAYAFHCPVDSLPFAAIWYGAPILLIGFIGAVLGPRLLSW